MKTWLAKLRISLALDANLPLSRQLRRMISGDEAVQRFHFQSQLLRGARRTATAPDPLLHEAIMAAVRSSAWPQAARAIPGTRLTMWLTPLLTTSAMVLICTWMADHRPLILDLNSPLGLLASLAKRVMTGALAPWNSTL